MPTTAKYSVLEIENSLIYLLSNLTFNTVMSQKRKDRSKYDGPTESLLCILLHTEQVFYMHVFETSIKVEIDLPQKKDGTDEPWPNDLYRQQSKM
jgi:hypothetical protein